MNASGLPSAFINEIRETLTDPEQWPAFLEACLTPLRRSIRVNGLKADAITIQDNAHQRDMSLTAVPWAKNGFWLAGNSTTTLGNWVEHLTGGFYIQEASSMLPAAALCRLLQQPNEQLALLDMAAAPGSKTTQLADWMQNQGILVANELSASRIKALAANVQRCGVRNTALTHFDASVFGHYLPGRFDGVLLDAPCSGEGTVRKDPQALEHWSKDAILQLATLQKRLIESAFHALKPGGVLIYSTCTLNQYENQQVCHHLLHTFPQSVEVIPLTDLFPGAERTATAEGFLHVWPHIYDSEGFFVAAFRKTGASEPDAEQLVVRRPKKFPYQPTSRKAVTALEQALAQQFGFTKPSGSVWYQRDQSFWLFPQAIEPLIGMMKYDRIGVKVADIVKSGYRIHHEFASTLADCCSVAPLELNQEQATQYLMGRDVDLTSPVKGEQLVSYRQQILGLVKPVNNRLKNQLPRELVRDGNLTL